MEDYDVGNAFRVIENELIASMIRNMEHHKVEEVNEGKQWSMWQTEQLKALEQYKHFNQKRFDGQFKDINSKMDDLIRMSSRDGEMSQEKAILQAVKNGFKPGRVAKGVDANFFRINSRKLDALLDETKESMKRVETAILRTSNDRYRKVIFNAQVYANSGAGTYEKAVDMATNDYLNAGINCVEYKNGRRVPADVYAEMALRTANKRAYLQGEGNKRAQWGVHTVIMNHRGTACPKCFQFSGKIFIDDVWSGGTSSDGPYPLLSNAIAQGLYHPNCKDSHTTYFPGVSEPPKQVSTEEKEEAIDEYNRQQKVNYYKHQEDACRRKAKYSLDDDKKKAYKKRANDWKDKKIREKHPMNQGIFSTINETGRTDVVRPYTVMNEMKKSQIGKEMLDFIINSQTPVNLCHNVNHAENTRGVFFPYAGEIYVYCDGQTTTEIAQTIIHEATHKKLNKPYNTRKEEVRCFINEVLHVKEKLTRKDLHDIIKHVNTVYPELIWR